MGTTKNSGNDDEENLENKNISVNGIEEPAAEIEQENFIEEAKVADKNEV